MELSEVVFWLFVALACGGFFYLMAFVAKKLALDLSSTLTGIWRENYLSDAYSLCRMLVRFGHIVMALGLVAVIASVYQRGFIS